MEGSDVEEDLMPESGIEKVQYSVLCSSHIEIHRHPVLLLLFIDEGLVILWIDISQIVPAGTGPLRHCVGFSLCIGSADRALAVDPFIHIGKRALSCAARLILVDLWQCERKLFLWNRDSSAVRAVYKWNRLTPISLA